LKIVCDNTSKKQKFNLQSNLVSHIIRSMQQWKMYCFATYQWPTAEMLGDYVHTYSHTHIILKHVPLSDQRHAKRYFISSNMFI